MLFDFQIFKGSNRLYPLMNMHQDMGTNKFTNAEPLLWKKHNLVVPFHSAQIPCIIHLFDF